MIASKLNGGGHSYAAGASITGKNSINIQTTDVVQSLQTVIES
jgi:nanoRNase/pAp phosphatase (c-di-AMP/oligoRNAs hydrolase)